jgi:hypothetical protein
MCGAEMQLRAISSYDPTGKRFGALWFCANCGHHNIDRFPVIDDSNKYLVKPAITMDEINYLARKINGKIRR